MNEKFISILFTSNIFIISLIFFICTTSGRTVHAAACLHSIAHEADLDHMSSMSQAGMEPDRGLLTDIPDSND